MIDEIIPELHFGFGLISVFLGTNHVSVIVPGEVWIGYTTCGKH